MIPLHKGQRLAASISYSELSTGAPLLNLRDQLRSLQGSVAVFKSVGDTLYLLLDGDPSASDLDFAASLLKKHGEQAVKRLDRTL